jgi:hypothetical protein
MKKILWIFEVVLFACLLSPTANATLISRDWQFAGDNGLTLDTATHLEWLDLTYTSNQSYSDVLSQLALGGTFAGFRYATVGDVTTLFEDAGIPDVGGTSAGNYAPVNELLGQVGRLVSLAGGAWSHAITGTSAGTDLQYYSNLQLTLGRPPFIGTAQPQAGTIATDSAVPESGSWLVRTVPEPSTLLLLALGLLLVACREWLGSAHPLSRGDGLDR